MTKILCILHQLKDLIDITSEEQLYGGDSQVSMSRGYVLYDKKGGVYLMVQKALYVCGINYFELENILGKVKELGFITSYELVRDDGMGEDNYFAVRPSRKFGEMLKKLEDEYHGSNSSIKQKENGGADAGLLLKIVDIIEHKLRKVFRAVPADEKEVQDALEDLFIGADISYEREAESISYSSKTYKPDFSIGDIDLLVEVKICDQKDREKRIIAEINDDILAYQTKHKNIIFAVYDLGFIRD